MSFYWTKSGRLLIVFLLGFIVAFYSKSGREGER
jgi:hypothetical protein